MFHLKNYVTFTLIVLLSTTYAVAGASPTFSYSINSSSVGEYLSADYASRVNDNETSSELYLKTLRENPDNLVLMESSYKLMLMAGRTHEAVELAKKFSAYDPKAASANIMISLSLIKEGKFKDAEKLIDQMLNDSNREVVSGIDFVLIELLKLWTIVGEEDFARADKYISKIKEEGLIPSGFLNYQIAVIQDLSGNLVEAAKQYQKIITVQDAPYHFIKAAGNFYERQGNTKLA